MPKLILASASPRRRNLLNQIGLTFDVFVSNIDEDAYHNLPPVAQVKAAALAKARNGASAVAGEALVIAADTIVVYQGNILGKPGSVSEAVTMLSLLSGKTHTVYTGVALVQAPSGQAKCNYAKTEVTFKHLSPAIIDSYVSTGEPMDKAGGYGIQGRGALLVKSIEGDYFNVVGLPLVKLAELMDQFGFDIWGVNAQWPTNGG